MMSLEIFVAKWRSKVTHVATPPAPCEGMGKPFPLDPKPGARLRGGREP